MKTAEVAIEHVLTGVLALCAFILPLVSGVSLKKDWAQSETIVGVLGVAYLFGIIFDKLGDMLLAPLEKWLRFRLAVDWLDKSGIHYEGDPFPQDALEFSLRANDNACVEWMDSLRSRIRTSRGTAVFGFPAVMGIAIYLSRFDQVVARGAIWHGWLYSTIAANLLILLLSIWISSREILAVPKTSKIACNLSNIQCQKKTAWIHVRVSLLCYALMLLACAVNVGKKIPLGSEPIVSYLVLVCGGMVSLLALRVWYLINETYMKFVYRTLLEFIEKKNRDAL